MAAWAEDVSFKVICKPFCRFYAQACLPGSPGDAHELTLEGAFRGIAYVKSVNYDLPRHLQNALHFPRRLAYISCELALCVRCHLPIHCGRG